MGEQKSKKDDTQTTQSNFAVEKSERSEIFASYDEPPPATLAAIQFQVASLLNDQHSVANWPGREPLLVNEPGGLAKKLKTLRRIAKAHFPSRGDLDDVLNQTIFDYGLWKWANPSGFWTAFKRDMIDAIKAAFEAKRISLEKATRNSSDGTRRECNSYASTASNEALATDEQTAQKWMVEERSELHADSIFAKWERAKASDRHQDRLIVGAVSRVMTDEGYMDELARTKREVDKLTRVITEIRSLAGCSQPEAYRLLASFKRRHYSHSQEVLGRARNF